MIDNKNRKLDLGILPTNCYANKGERQTILYLNIRIFGPEIQFGTQRSATLSRSTSNSSKKSSTKVEWGAIRR